MTAPEGTPALPDHGMQGVIVTPLGRLNAQRAEAMLDAWEKSGESADAFCRRLGLKERTFARWRLRLRGSMRPSADLARIVVAPQTGRETETIDIVPGSPPVIRIPLSLADDVVCRLLRVCTC